MNRLTKLISGTVALAAIMGGTLVAGHSLASVPCIQYTPTNLQTSTTPLFNDICGVPSLLSSSEGTYPIGDEPDFVRIRPNISGNDTVSKDNPKLTSDLTSACTDGSKFDIWTYVHNNASQDFNNNGSGSAVAHDVKVALAASGVNTTKSNFTFGSTVSAANADSVSDTATLNCGGKQVTLTLVPSSVHYNNNLQQTTYGNLPDSAVNSTTGIGSPVFPNDGLGGIVWGCWDFRTVIVYQVVVKDVPAPVVTATCDFFNVLSSSDRKVTVSQFKFTAVNAVFSSAVIDWGDGSTPTTSASPVGQTHQYATEGTFTIKATAHFTINGIDVGVTSATCAQQVTFTPTPVTPVFTCDQFDIKADAATRKVTATAFKTTATNGAVFKDAVIDWGDGSTPTTSASPVGQTHQYTKDGTFTIKTTAHFTVNGQDVTATSGACQKQVVFTPVVVTPVYTCDLFTVQSDTTNRVVQVTALNTTAKNGAVYKHTTINWGDDSTPLNISNPVNQTHQYAKDGTFAITATAHFTVNGQDVTATSATCNQEVTFKTLPPPVTPVYTCDKFQITADADRMVKVSAFAATATNGATFKNATIDWGDSTAATSVTTIAGVTGQTHQFNADGTFMVSITAHFMVNGQEVTAAGPQCQAQVKFVPNQPPETPVFSCDQFEIQAQANRSVKLTAFATTAKNGATFAIASIDWGDSTAPLSTNNVVGQTHQYAQDGTYVVTATTHFTVDGKDLVAGSVKCQKQVAFKTDVPPVVTPPTVTPPSTPTGTLVNTGPGENLAALFAAATAFGMIAYRRMLARSLRG